MQQRLVMTLIGEDRPGVVEQLSATINRFQGNWLESRMAHLAGKFAGILELQVAAEQAAALQQALEQLPGLHVHVETGADSSAAPVQSWRFSLVGSDRPGIVREVAQALAQRSINVVELATDCSSAPWTGEPLFTAEGWLQVPEALNMEELHDALERIGNELTVEIDLHPAQGDN